MAGIAEAVGVSKATVYLYVESKDALLWLCRQHADDPNEIERPDVLPVPTPAPGRMLAHVEARINRGCELPLRRRGTVTA
jgi:AcrR family transcriptional regulator